MGRLRISPRERSEYTALGRIQRLLGGGGGGGKPVLLVAVAVFFIGSLIYVDSINIGTLIIGRAIQESAAGGVVILENICIGDLDGIR